jgi:hypothetical protein
MESNTLPSKYRKPMQWLYMAMMIIAAVAAIGNAFFG